jgi:hypothetical protein
MFTYPYYLTYTGDDFLPNAESFTDLDSARNVALKYSQGSGEEVYITKVTRTGEDQVETVSA